MGIINMSDMGSDTHNDKIQKTAIYIVEVVHLIERPGLHPVIIHEFICPKSSMDEALSYLKNRGINEKWHEPVYSGAQFACFMISLEYLDDENGPYDVFCYNLALEHIMNINDQRPYKKEGYPD